MDTPPVTLRNYLPSILALVLIGWGGLAALLYFSLPYVWSRWGFFVLGIMAVTGTAMPLVYFVNRLFPGDLPAEPNVIARQSIWVGVYFATLAWLQLGRLVTIYLVLGLAAGLVGLEYFIRMREKAVWKKPSVPDDHPA